MTTEPIDSEIIADDMVDEDVVAEDELDEARNKSFATRDDRQAASLSTSGVAAETVARAARSGCLR